jgi:uncharacterized protein DUF6463
LSIGGLAHWTQSRSGTLPAFLGWSLLALGLFGAILVPVSGFWVVLPQAVMMLVVARREATVEAEKPTQTLDYLRDTHH